MQTKRILIFFVATVTVSGIFGCGGNGNRSILPDSKDASAAIPSSTEDVKPTPVIEEMVPMSRDPEKIIDQTQTTRSGPTKYWTEATGLGYNNNMTYTYVNGSSVSNSMLWRSGLSSGSYEIDPFVPRLHATTRSAQYRIGYMSGNNFVAIKVVPLNQYNYSDVWVSLGTFSFPGEPAVYLGDDTGESYSTKRVVGFDAVKFKTIAAQGPDLSSFIKSNSGKKVGDGQCVALAHAWAKATGMDVPKHDYAYQFANTNPTGWKWIANTPTGVPSPGDLVVWDHKAPADKSAGHIDVFVSGDTNNFTGFDQNWPVNSLCHTQSHKYSAVLGWLHRTP